jgi:hypothetical protein
VTTIMQAADAGNVGKLDKLISYILDQENEIVQAKYNENNGMLVNATLLTTHFIQHHRHHTNRNTAYPYQESN